MFLRGILIFMSIYLSQAMAFAEHRNPKIVIIGAGLAGLTTAYRLHQKGMDVTLYEAQDRVGGRIYSVNVSDDIGELGGQSITDGGEAPNILRLIKELKLELNENKILLNHSFFDGNSCTEMKGFVNRQLASKDNLRDQLNNLKSSCRSMKEIFDSLLEPDSPLYRSLATRLAAYEGGTIEKLSTEYVETLFYMLTGGICSVHQDKNINLLSVKGGNSLLPYKIAKILGKNLHLQMPLTKVSNGIGNKYILTFENGSKILADILVLAIPCSVLEQITFEIDDLDQDRLNAMKSLSYGTNAKILIPFIGAPLERLSLVQDNMISFFSNASILTLYCAGEKGQFSDQEASDIYQNVQPSFSVAYKNLAISKKPVIYADGKAYTHYDSPVGYSWLNDPYARGSYSYIGAGQEQMLSPVQEENGEIFKSLFSPIEGKLFFVGEHTTINEDIRGTMEAACESGERCARAILKKYALHRF